MSSDKLKITPEELDYLESMTPSDEVAKACLEDTIEKAHDRVIQNKIKKIEDQLKELSIYVTKSLQAKTNVG